VRADYDNLLAALEWSFAQPDASIGLRLAASLSEFWYYEGSISQSQKWTEVALKRVDQATPDIHAKVLNGASMMAFVFGQHERGKKLNQEALAIARQAGDLYNQAWALLWLSAHTTNNPDEYIESIQFSEEAVALFGEINDQAGLAWGYNQIGESTRLVGDFERAGKAYEAALVICRQTGNRRREAISLVNLSYVVQRQGEYDKAEKYVIEGLNLLYSLDLRYHCAIALAMLAGPVASQGKGWRAAKLLGASQAIFERMSISLQPADQVEIDCYADAAAKQIGQQAYQVARAEGQRLSFDQAMAYAIQKDLDIGRSLDARSEALSRDIIGEQLSQRELEVLHQLATGLSIEEIAVKFYISPSTLRTHTKNIYRKLDVHRRVEAVERGKELGLL
jgi:ATP/maltotriose-dependent transcriptional regulator MalT